MANCAMYPFVSCENGREENNLSVRVPLVSSSNYEYKQKTCRWLLSVLRLVKRLILANRMLSCGWVHIQARLLEFVPQVCLFFLVLSLPLSPSPSPSPSPSHSSSSPSLHPSIHAHAILLFRSQQKFLCFPPTFLIFSLLSKFRCVDICLLSAIICHQ